MTCNIIATDRLCRSFGMTQVLNNVSFSIDRGSVCSLLGPNGAGKTTLIKLLMGLIEPTSGTCQVAGEGALPRSQAALQSVACLINGVEPPGNTRIADLISLNREVGPAFELNQALELLHEKRLLAGARWKTLSKGHKRWTLLTLLLCRGCDLLLLDEPADGLDPEARLELYQLIRREANRRSVTALVATHVIHDIEKVADEVCILHQGRLVLHEDLEDLREQLVVVELAAPVEIPGDVQILRLETNDQITCWIRDITGSLEATLLPGEIRRRKAGLEEIYLAVVKQADDQLARLFAGINISANDSDQDRRMIRAMLKPALLRWQLRQLSTINLIAVVAVILYVLLRQQPMAPPGELPIQIAVLVHCGLIVWKLGCVKMPQTAFLHTQGFTRDQIWWQTLFASAASGFLVCVIAWLLMVTRLRSLIQDQWYQNGYFPFYAPEEFLLPWSWLFEYAIALPLMHYAWVRANQPCRGAASGWMVMTLGLCILLWTFDRLGIHHWETSFLLFFAALHVPAAFLLMFGCWRLHRTMEVPS